MQLKKKQIKILILLIIIIIISIIGIKKFKNQNIAPQMQPVAVTSFIVSAQDLPLIYEYSGRTSAFLEVEIRPRVNGTLLNCDYKEGQLIKKGEVLCKIDPDLAKTSLKQAQAKFNQSRFNWNRAGELFKNKVISTKAYEEAQSVYEQAKAALETARINLNYTTVTAPFTGIASKQEIDEGSLLTANSSLLTRLIQLDPIHINFSYSDTEFLKKQKQLSEGKIMLPKDKKILVKLIFEDGTEYNNAGVVNFTDTIINADTGTINASAIIPNPEAILLPGQFVRIKLEGLIKKDAIIIPDKSIMQGPQGPFVYVVDAENKAAIKSITLGDLYERNRIIETGLKDGDQVITEGMIKIRPGLPITASPSLPEASTKQDINSTTSIEE